MHNDRQDLTGKKVLVGLTGRVDSALAAFLLKKQGMQVIGLSLVTTPEDIVEDQKFQPKCHISDLDKVKNLCEQMDIPFYASDLKSQFDSEVIDRIVANKLVGSANASCFYCTQTRLEVMYQKMKALGADYIATGHYAKVRMNLNSKEYYIHSNSDNSSDQSFLLAAAPAKILNHLLLPLGELSKTEIKKYAEHFKLTVEDSSKQVGFCFRKQKASKKVLESRLPKAFIRPGPVENIDTGLALGEHEGAIYHYITESQPVFKNSPHIDKNLEVIDYNYKTATLKMGTPNYLTFEGVQLTRVKLSEGVDRSGPLTCFLKFKYSNAFVKADMYFKNSGSVFLKFDEEVYPLIKGEVIVIYDSDSSNSKILGWGLANYRGTFKLINRVGKFESSSENEEKKSNKALSPFKF